MADVWSEVRDVLVPRRRSWPSALAATAAWLGVLGLLLGVGASAVVVVWGGGEHGGAGFAFGAVGIALVLIAGACLVRRLEQRRARWTRALGGFCLLGGAYFTAWYPYSWLRDPYSIPLVIALVGVILTVGLLLAAWTLLRRA